MKCQGYEFEDDQLTFAEAMALDPSEVEFCPTPPGKRANHWWPFDTWRQYGHMDMRDGSWRRARPKRSRVQEMAEEFRRSDTGIGYEDSMAHAIRAVCEYISDWFAGDPEHRGHLRSDIEHEFLEPR